jgi:hypothetical protein
MFLPIYPQCPQLSVSRVQVQIEPLSFQLTGMYPATLDKDGSKRFIHSGSPLVPLFGEWTPPPLFTFPITAQASFRRKHVLGEMRNRSCTYKFYQALVSYPTSDHHQNASTAFTSSNPTIRCTFKFCMELLLYPTSYHHCFVAAVMTSCNQISCMRGRKALPVRKDSHWEWSPSWRRFPAAVVSGDQDLKELEKDISILWRSFFSVTSRDEFLLLPFPRG